MKKELYVTNLESRWLVGSIRLIIKPESTTFKITINEPFDWLLDDRAILYIEDIGFIIKSKLYRSKDKIELDANTVHSIMFEEESELRFYLGSDKKDEIDSGIIAHKLLEKHGGAITYKGGLNG